MIRLSIDLNSRRRVTLVRRFLRAEFVVPALALAALATVTTPHLTHASDERLDSLAYTTARLQGAVSVFRQRAGIRYDPAIDGWMPLVHAGYLKKAPVNPVTGSSDVSRGPSATAGWCFDPMSGRLEACVVDVESGEARLLSHPR